MLWKIGKNDNFSVFNTDYDILTLDEQNITEYMEWHYNTNMFNIIYFKHT